jgi:forkhead transcription factor HCM1
MNSDERFHPEVDGLPVNMQAGELAEARTLYTLHVSITPWEDGIFPNNPKYHQDSCTPQKVINAHVACAQSAISESPLPNASPGGLAPSKAGSGSKGSKTRTYSEMASSTDVPSEAWKQERQEGVSSPLIDTTDIPPDTIDGTRPRYRYATLIGMAILRSQKRCLTLAHVSKWISDNFAYYSLANSGWQNSIRHSPTLNKKFIKIGRTRDDPGKVSYWAIEPGQEHTFVQDEENARRSMMSTRTLRYIHTTTQEVDSSFKVVTAHTTRQSTPGLYEKTSGKASGSLEQTHEVVQSSDDKITVVNSCLQEHGMDTATAVVPALVPPRSPRPPRKHNSRVHRIETSPYRLVGGLKETSGHHWQEKGGSLDSSEFGCPNESSMGYIEPHRLVLKQAAGRSRFGAGRAEAEIARIRSSHTESLEYYGRTQSSRSLSSSQGNVRSFDTSTSVVASKDPISVFPSVSPETNLRTHRKNTRVLLGSPASPFFSLASSPSP